MPPSRQVDSFEAHYSWDCEEKSEDEKAVTTLKCKTSKAKGRSTTVRLAVAESPLDELGGRSSLSLMEW